MLSLALKEVLMTPQLNLFLKGHSITLGAKEFFFTQPQNNLISLNQLRLRPYCKKKRV